MPYTPAHKERSRARIIAAAARLFSERGFEKVTIDQVMAAAGMTRGAFYSHFPNKATLYAESITGAAVSNPRAQEVRASPQGPEQLLRLTEAYLSEDHVAGENQPCPLGFLVTDIVHREPEGRRAYREVYERFTQLIADQLPGRDPSQRTHGAYAISALLIGGVALSRAVSDDPAIMRTLLASCREAVEELMTGEA